MIGSRAMEVISGEEDFPALSTLASVESLSMPLMQEVVLLADIGCADCRNRIAEVMSRMNEVESVTVSVREKKVTLSCRYSYPSNATVPTATKQQQQAIYRKNKSFNKIALIKKIFRGA